MVLKHELNMQNKADMFKPDLMNDNSDQSMETPICFEVNLHSDEIDQISGTAWSFKKQPICWMPLATSQGQ